MNSFTQEVEDYLFYCRFQKELDQKTIKAYRIDLTQFFSQLSLQKSIETIEKEDMNQYLYFLHANYKQKTVKRKIASTKAFFAYLRDEDKMTVNPYDGVKTKFREEFILPRTIPRDTIQELFRYLYRQRKKKENSQERYNLLTRDIAVIEMLFATGLRISELCGLRDNMFDMQDGVLCIKGKGAKERYLQIENQDVMDIRYIQKMLGHSSIMTTQIYTYVASEKQRQILRLKHPRNQMQVIENH